SLLTIINSIPPDNREIVRNGDITEFRFTYTKEGRQHHVVAIESRIRSWLYYENPLDPNLDTTITHELTYLCNSDGIIFVIDSRVFKGEQNLLMFEKLDRDLVSRRIDIDSKPIVFQVNKRDLSDICSMDWVREHFRTQRCDYVESIATQGIGTREALDKLLDLIEK
ncbi:MAG: hypothetical protein JW902_07335, partial [Syntrophaceae bacterium]|nr:hypothetical protein [Syntrophaceae bacterium]